MRDVSFVRTTLTLDDDILDAAKAIAAARGVPIGEVISELVRTALSTPTQRSTRNGITLFPARAGAGRVTPDIVRTLLDESA